MSTQWSCILFDLDGTILDSAPGITETLAYMFEKLERPVPSQARLLEYVGPPILDSFRDLAGMSPAQSLAALDVYRVRYLERGALGSTVYPGVGRLLRQVAESPLPALPGHLEAGTPGDQNAQPRRAHEVLRRDHRCVRRRGSQQ